MAVSPRAHVHDHMCYNYKDNRDSFGTACSCMQLRRNFRRGNHRTVMTTPTTAGSIIKPPQPQLYANALPATCNIIWGTTPDLNFEA